MRTLHSGFTLIELMIVVAIISILAAFAIPAYHDYTIRAKVTEGLGLASTYRVGISEVFQARGPTDMTCSDAATCSALGLTPVLNNANVDRILSDSSGVIAIHYSTNVVPSSTNVLTLTPVVPAAGGGTVPLDLMNAANAGLRFDWDCGRVSVSTLPLKHRPANCR